MQRGTGRDTVWAGNYIHGRHTVEVARFYYESVPFPVATCTTEPRPDFFLQLRPAVERDDPCFMNQFVIHHDITGSLHDLQTVVVGKRDHRCRHATGDAAIEWIEITDIGEYFLGPA